MKIKVLGSGTAIPSLKRVSSAYLVITEKCNILVDIGPSVVRRLLEFGYSVDDIDVIFITHFHVDHTADLSTFFFACNYGEVMRTKPLFIAAGHGMLRFYKNLSKVYPWILPKLYELKLYSFQGEAVEIFDIKARAARVNHNKESVGIRIDSDGKSAVFSGDTDYSVNLAKLAQGTDILVVDCAFPEKKVKGHLNLNTLERIVKKAVPKKVLLSHLYPEWEDYRGVLHAPYLMAEDGVEILL